MRRIAKYISLVALVLGISSCTKVETPVKGTVNIALDNYGLWSTFGVSGVGAYRKFIKSERVPSNFSYTALSYTGVGGVLLICDVTNTPLAYELTCPYEKNPTIRINIDSNTYEAVCPKCGSRYNVIEAYGAPISGPAIENKVGLTRYNVMSATTGGYVICN